MKVEKKYICHFLANKKPLTSMNRRKLSAERTQLETKLEPRQVVERVVTGSMSWSVAQLHSGSNGWQHQQIAVSRLSST